jgi:hypothetical protein
VDFSASALIPDEVTILVPGLYCDISSLTDDAESIENKMKEVRNGHNKSLSFYK